MFKFRIIGFFLLILLLCGIFFWEHGMWLFILAAPAMVGAAVGECCKMLNDSGRPAFIIPSALTAWLSAAGFMIGFVYTPAWITVFVMYLLLIMAAAALFLTLNRELMKKVFNSAGVLLVFSPALILLLSTFFLSYPSRGYWLIFLCLVTKATDTGGYIAGTLTAGLPGGNHKIAPTVSPKKSWEGLAGGMLLSVAVSLAFYFIRPSELNIYWHIAAGFILSVGSFFGDLTESAVKRMCEIKDSGSFVPGMGGAFDVLDSFIYNGTVFWIIYSLGNVFCK